MPKASPSVELALSELARDGTARLRIHFPEKTLVQPGESATVAEAKPDPTLFVSPDALKSTSGKYIAASIDVDAPFPSFTIFGPALHWLQTDLVVGAADADGWTALSTTAKPVARYAGPQPPKPSAAHRYVFMVWEQPEGMDVDKARTVLGLSNEPGIPARMRWDQELCEKKLGLGQCLAANYFLTKA